MHHPAILQRYHGTRQPTDPEHYPLWVFPPILQEEDPTFPDVEGFLHGYVILYVPKAYALRPHATVTMQLEHLEVTPHLTDMLYRKWLEKPDSYRKRHTAEEYQDVIFLGREGLTHTTEVRPVTCVADGKRYYAALLFGDAGLHRIVSPQAANDDQWVEIEYGTVSEEHLFLPEFGGEFDEETSRPGELHLGEEASWD